MGQTKLFGDNGEDSLGDCIFEVSLDHETSCFYGFLTTDPICTSVGVTVLQLQGVAMVGSGQLEDIQPVSRSSPISSILVQ